MENAPLLVVGLGSTGSGQTIGIADVGELAVYGSEQELGESNGFYDYLRVDPTTIVGLRWTPFPEAEFVLEGLAASPRVEVVSNGSLKALLVWFDERTSFEAAISDDQRFVSNRVLRSPQTGEFSVTFGVSFLSAAELEGIKSRLSRGQRPTM